MPKPNAATIKALAKGVRGAPTMDNLAKARASMVGGAVMIVPGLPQTRDQSTLVPSYDAIIDRLNELAKLNVEAFKEVLAEFDLLDPEGVRTYEQDELQPIADRVREVLDAERAKISSGGELQLSASAPKALSPKAKKLLAAVKSRAHFENLDTEAVYAKHNRKT